MLQQWTDAGKSTVRLCERHDNSDAAEHAILHRWGRVVGQVRPDVTLVGHHRGEADGLCDHPNHGRPARPGPFAATPEPKVSADDLLDLAEVAEMMGLQPSSLRAMRAQPARHRRIDRMPDPIRTVGNAPVWDRHQIERWLTAP